MDSIKLSDSELNIMDWVVIDKETLPSKVWKICYFDPIRVENAIAFCSMHLTLDEYRNVVVRRCPPEEARQLEEKELAKIKAVERFIKAVYTDPLVEETSADTEPNETIH